MRRLRRGALLILALSAVYLSATGAGSSLARFNTGSASGANAITAGIWAFYLHNNPTPPTGNTPAQYNLTMTAVVPTPVPLYFYDTDKANRAGRGITRNNPPSPGLLTNFRYVNWRTPAFASTFTLGTTVTIDIWSATNINTANRTGSLIVYLRDYNPTAGTYVEIANNTRTATYAAGRTWYRTPITVTVAAGTTLAVGHMLEVKIESPTATSQNNMLVAYDTQTYPSVARLR
jgi:hypothetical protein